jgi:hypothetical protein
MKKLIIFLSLLASITIFSTAAQAMGMICPGDPKCPPPPPVPCPANLYNLSMGAAQSTYASAAQYCVSYMLGNNPYAAWAAQCQACGGQINAPTYTSPPPGDFTKYPGLVYVSCGIQVAQCNAP